MIVVNGENYRFKVFKRKPNSPYEWEKESTITFKGRPASQFEKKQYRIQQGVNGGSDSVFVISSNLPKELGVKDKVLFQGKEWTIASIGYYYDQAKFINASLFSDEYIESRCPKGINLQ